MTVLVTLARSSRWLLVTALLSSALNGVLTSRVIALMNRSLSVRRDELAALGLQFAVVSVVALAVRWFSLAQFVRLSQGALAQLRRGIAHRIAHLPFSENERRGPARLLAVLAEDTSTLGDCFMIVPWLLLHGVVLLGCLGYLLVLSPPAFAFLCLLIAIGSLGYRRGARRAQASLREARAEEDVLFEHFRALFSGAKELKLHTARRDAFLGRVLGASAERVERARRAGLLTHARLSHWRLFLLFSAIGSLLFWVGPALALPEEVRSSYALTLLYMILPLHSVLEAAPMLGRMRVALERIELLGIEAEGAALASAPTAAAPIELVRLRGVTHEYRREDDEHAFVLGPLSMELRAGEVTFLVGGNGSGKTSLAKLITGLYEPREGTLEVVWRAADRRTSEPIREPSARDRYKESVAAIFSDFHLFDGLEAIPEPSMEAKAKQLLERLHLDRKVTLSEGRFSTTALSSGQRKRLALLVAWLQDRSIYVFDEWAADQDPHYKEVFYREILPDLARRGKVVLAITHDDRYFHLAQRCYKLEDGRLSDGVAQVPSPFERAPLGIESMGLLQARLGET